MSRSPWIAASLVLVGCYGSTAPSSGDSGVATDAATDSGHDAGVDASRDAEADASQDGGVHVNTICVPRGEDGGVFALGTYRDTLVRAYAAEIPTARITFDEFALDGNALHSVNVDLLPGRHDVVSGELFPMWSGEIVFVSVYRDVLLGCDLETEACRTLPRPVVTDLIGSVRYDFFSDGRYLYAAYHDELPTSASGFLRLDLREPSPTWEPGWRAYALASGDYPADSILGSFTLRRVGLVDAVYVGADGLPAPGRYRVVAMDWPCAVEVTPYSPIWDDDIPAAPFVELTGEQIKVSFEGAPLVWSTERLRRRASDSTVLGEVELYAADVPDVFELADGRFLLDGVIVDAAVTNAVAFPNPSRGEFTGGFSARYPANFPGDTTLVP